MNDTNNTELLEEYSEKMIELLPLARRAFGPKDQDTPNHVASREYTRLLVEFHARGGSLTDLANRLGVAYSGLRRRLFTSDIPSVRRVRLPKGTISVADVEAAAARVKIARDISTGEYHRQLHAEFTQGIPMNMLARQLGISNAAPLYYGVQSHEKRTTGAQL